MIPKSTDLAEADAIAVESDNFGKPPRVPRGPHLDGFVDERRHAD
jgi:hypothetical protein